MSSRVVLDASASLRVVMGMDEGGRLTAVLKAAAVVIAPNLYASEVANGLRGYTAAGALDRPDAVDRYEEALDLVDDLVADRELGVEALGESIRCGHPAYDLVYAVLARRTGSALLTMDRRLAGLLPQLGVPLALDL